MLTCLCVVYGCFPATMGELSRSKRDHRDHKAENIYSLVLYGKSLLSLALDHTCFFKPNSILSLSPLWSTLEELGFMHICTRTHLAWGTHLAQAPPLMGSLG